MNFFDFADHAIMTYLVVFITAVGFVLLLIPVTIKVAETKQLLDEPDERKKHACGISNFGGIPIFFTLTFSTILLNVNYYFENWHYVLAALLLLFMVGLKDDLTNISPRKKFLGQLLAAVIVVCLADIRIVSFHGFLGLYELPYIFSVIFSILGITFVTNAFNLIDGIDGLAGSLATLIFLFFGGVFAYIGVFGLAVACFTIAGAIFGFLRYNFSPAKIFMGDNGSLVIGFLISVLCIEFSSIISTLPVSEIAPIINLKGGGLTIAFATIIIPVIDTFAVFISRISCGNSPFYPDRKHIHHALLDVGLNSREICGLLILMALLFIFCALGFSYFGFNPTASIISLTCIAGCCFVYIKKFLLKHKSIK